MEAYIQLEGLHFHYARGKPLFEGLDLRVEAGVCFGILGPNGAGKTTLMKLMLRLLRPSSGRALLFGRSPGTDRGVFARTGVLVEGPHLYPHLSGRANGRVQATYRGIAPGRVDAVLRLVGLEAAADRPVRQYSTGMRQRLALAIALLPDPDLLFLDEPTQGLDPQGIADMRAIVQRLHRQQGKTIVLSSHLLSEVEQICTHLGVLEQGRLLFTGSLAKLRARFPASASLEIEVDDPPGARSLLQAAGFESGPADGPKLRVEVERRAAIPEVIDRLRAGGIGVFALQPRQQKLEDLFLQLLAENARSRAGNRPDDA